MSYSTGFNTYTSNRKVFRLFFRITHCCPSLLYSLHRKNTIKQLKIVRFDYYDIYLSLWYELNSSFRIIPIPLFIAGTNGVRAPYSLISNYINCNLFIKACWKLFREHFSFMSSILIMIPLQYLIMKNTKIQNGFIKKSINV